MFSYFLGCCMVAFPEYYLVLQDGVFYDLHLGYIMSLNRIGKWALKMGAKGNLKKKRIPVLAGQIRFHEREHM